VRQPLVSHLAEHPHGGAWYACCLETLLADALAGGRQDVALVASKIREHYALPRLDPVEVKAELPSGEPTPPERPWRYRVRRISGGLPCSTCGAVRRLPYILPGQRGSASTSPRECVSCYRSRR